MEDLITPPPHHTSPLPPSSPTAGTTTVNLPFHKHSSTVAARKPRDKFQMQVSTASTPFPPLLLERRGLKQQTTWPEGLGGGEFREEIREGE